MFKTISEPVLERMDDQYRSLKESIDAKIDAQNTKYNVLIWVMGIGFTLLLAFSFFGN